MLLALVAAASSPAWRHRAPAAARWCLAAGLGAITALGLVGMAVLGDGYFEIFKHVWLAAYLLVVTALSLLGALVAGTQVLARRLGTRTVHPGMPVARPELIEK